MKNLTESRLQAIANAKLVLKQAGYYVDNLWHILDVMERFNCDNEEQAQSILHDALTNEYIVEKIFEQIFDFAQCENLTENK
jgi:hypothetical protein